MRTDVCQARYLERLSPKRNRHRLVILFALFSTPVTVGAADFEPFNIRNHNPFLRVYGIPPAEINFPNTPRQVLSRLSLDIVNHADSSSSDSEAIEMDGESYFLDFSFRYGISPRFALGLDIPLVRHANGVFDNAIEGWHNLLGLSNSKRNGPSNRLALRYLRNDITVVDVRSATTGIADVRLSGYWRIASAGSNASTSMIVVGSIEFPTGNASKLHGSGGTDIALGFAVGRPSLFGNSRFGLSLSAGLVFPGLNELAEDLKEDMVPYGTATLSWRLRPWVDLKTGLQVHGAFFDSDLDELGGKSTELLVGATFRSSKSQLLVNVAFAEDLISDATPDIVFHLGLGRQF